VPQDIAPADFYGVKKIPDENDIPPEYHFHPDYALYGVKFLSYFTQKNFIRPGSMRLDEIIPSDFIQMEVDEIWRCSYLVGMYASPRGAAKSCCAILLSIRSDVYLVSPLDGCVFPLTTWWQGRIHMNSSARFILEGIRRVAL